MSDQEQRIDCAKHGEGIAATVCGHLVCGPGSPLGFIENSSNPADLQAWCYDCENLYEQEGEMTPKFREFHDLTMICTECYATIKGIHGITT